MKVKINPPKSQLGIIKTCYESIENQKGRLSVIFRYSSKKMNFFKSGYQVQFETIANKEFRGNHYHYPKFSGEEFCLINGKAVLTVCNLNNSIFELYLLEEEKTYYVPAFVAHKVENIGYYFGNSRDVKLIIAKHYNYKQENLQSPHNISSQITDKYIDKLIQENYNEL